MRKLVVLSEEDLIYCYEEGVHVRLYTRLPARGELLVKLKHYQQKGEYDPADKRVAIYLSHIQELADYKLTLFHEFAHAVDHLLFDVKYSERRIEQIAQNTYQTNEELFEFIKEMYRLPEIRFGKK